MRVYGIGCKSEMDLGATSLHTLGRKIGDNLVKAQVMIVNNKFLEQDEFITNLDFKGLVEYLSERGLVTAYEEEDGYILRALDDTNPFDVTVTEYKIVEVLG